MLPPNPRAGDHGARWLRAAAGVFAGFALLAAINACGTAITVPLPPAGGGLRAAHLVVNAAETLGLGALAAILVGAFAWYARRAPWAVACATGAATAAVVYCVIGWRLVRFAAHALDGRLETAILLAYYVVLGVGFPALLRLASALSRHRFLGLAPVAFAVCVIVVDQRCLPDDYADMHGIVALGAAIVGGVGLAPLAVRAGRGLWRGPRGRGALGGLGLFALTGLAWPPSNATRIELFRQPCAIAPWVLATALWSPPRPHTPVRRPRLRGYEIDPTIRPSAPRRRGSCHRTRSWSS